MDLQRLLAEIEMDMQELRFLLDAFTKNPDEVARRVVKRTMERTQGRLTSLLEALQTYPVNGVERLMQETVIPTVPGQVIVNEFVVSQVITSSAILGECIRPAADLKHSISLNDSFRFSRELFDGNSERMNGVLQKITEFSSLDEALLFLDEEVKADKESEVLADFQELLKKFFNIEK